MDRESKEPAGDATSWALKELVDAGVLCIRSGYYYNRLCFAPPLVIEQGQIDQGLQKLDLVLRRMEKKFGITA